MEKNYNLVATTSQVDEAIGKMADQIINNHESSPLFVALLRGAAPFASKLMFAITKISPEYNPELDYMMISTYGHDRTASKPVIVTDLAPSTNVQDRAVVILDDVIDQGVTSDFTKELLLNRGASQVELATLASKNVPSRLSNADYCGFDAGDKWLVGMGLDDARAAHEAYRWIGDIWEVRR